MCFQSHFSSSYYDKSEGAFWESTSFLSLHGIEIFWDDQQAFLIGESNVEEEEERIKVKFLSSCI